MLHFDELARHFDELAMLTVFYLEPPRKFEVVEVRLFLVRHFLLSCDVVLWAIGNSDPCD